VGTSKYIHQIFGLKITTAANLTPPQQARQKENAIFHQFIPIQPNNFQQLLNGHFKPISGYVCRPAPSATGLDPDD